MFLKYQSLQIVFIKIALVHNPKKNQTLKQKLKH